MQLANYSQRFYDGHMMDSGTSLVGLFFMLLVLGTIVWAVIYLARTFSQNSQPNSTLRDPLDIARERYAKGEITKQELTEMKKELK